MRRKKFKLTIGGVRLVSDDSKIGAMEEPFPIGCKVITIGPEEYGRCPLNTIGEIKCHGIGCYGVNIQTTKDKKELRWYKRKNLALVEYDNA